MQVCLVFIYLIQAMLLLNAPNLASALSKPQFLQSDSYSLLFATFNVSTPSHYTMRFPLSLFLEVSCLNCSFNFQKQDAKNFFSFSFFASNWTCEDFLCIQINIHLPVGMQRSFVPSSILERGAKNFCSLYTIQRPSYIWGEVQEFWCWFCFCSLSAHLCIQNNINPTYQSLSIQPCIRGL